MYRDISNIPQITNCIKITDDKNLIVYTNDNTTTYTLIGDKYYAKEEFEVNTPQTEAICYTTEQIQDLPSPFDFITPIYHVVAIVTALFILYGAYRLIIYPFFRKSI